jgi:NAD(P)H-dependent flavin oxidoreductase YrpB (nitropropane dioxygenase family)
MNAGMGRIAMAELVAAVCNAGGFGVIGATGMRPELLRETIHEVRHLTDKPFGVDILLPSAPVRKGDTTISGADPGVTAGAVPAKLPALPEDMVKARDDFKARHRIPDPKRKISEGRMSGERSSPGRIRDLINVTLEERPALFVSGLGTPGPLVGEFHERGIKVMSLVGNVRTAIKAAQEGVDAVIAQGHESGGHTGRIGAMALVPQVVDAVAPLPVVAAGGIGDGRGVTAALALGAVGVWCGTIFAASREANMPLWYKLRCIASGEDDTLVTKSYSGKPQRIQRNKLAEAWDKEIGKYLPMPYQGMLYFPLHQAVEDYEMTEYMGRAAGQVMGLIKKLRGAGEIVRDLVSETEAIVEKGLIARAPPATKADASAARLKQQGASTGG